MATLLAKVQAVARRYPAGYLFARQYEALLQLKLGDYALTDYTFHLAEELEKMLRRQHATPTTELLAAGVPLLRLATPHDPTPP